MQHYRFQVRLPAPVGEVDLTRSLDADDFDDPMMQMLAAAGMYESAIESHVEVDGETLVTYRISLAEAFAERIGDDRVKEIVAESMQEVAPRVAQEHGFDPEAVEWEVL